MKKPTLFALLLPSVVLATSIAPHSLGDRARISNRVVLAQVLSQRVVTENGDPRRMKTLTDVLVGTDIKGQGVERLQIVQQGGDLGLWSAHIPGDAQFKLGETAILFLSCREADRCALVSLGEGKIALDGDQAFVHDMFTRSWSKRAVKDVIAEIKNAEARR